MQEKSTISKNYYDILGVSRDANRNDIKQAFKQLSFKYHPDRNPDDKANEAKFKEMTIAYEVLSDEEKRKQYDAELKFSELSKQFSSLSTSVVTDSSPKNADSFATVKKALDAACDSYLALPRGWFFSQFPNELLAKRIKDFTIAVERSSTNGTYENPENYRLSLLKALLAVVKVDLKLDPKFKDKLQNVLQSSGTETNLDKVNILDFLKSNEEKSLKLIFDKIVSNYNFDNINNYSPQKDVGFKI